MANKSNGMKLLFFFWCYFWNLKHSAHQSYHKNWLTSRHKVKFSCFFFLFTLNDVDPTRNIVNQRSICLQTTDTENTLFQFYHWKWQADWQAGEMRQSNLIVLCTHSTVYIYVDVDWIIRIKLFVGKIIRWLKTYITSWLN